MNSIQWTGDHFSMEEISNLDIGIMEHENGYDLYVDHKEVTLKVRLNQWVTLKDNEIFVTDKGLVHEYLEA